VTRFRVLGKEAVDGFRSKGLKIGHSLSRDEGEQGLTGQSLQGQAAGA
jgi:hypothetical protein